jgi:outer membrane immunogenic protein
MWRAILVTVALLANAVAARAADLPERPVQPYVPPAFSWAGFYIGGNVGGAWARRQWTDSTLGVDLNGETKSGFLAGGQIGGNYQRGMFVAGVELEFEYAGNGNANNTGVFVPAVGGNVVVSSGSRWLSTLAVRLGVAVDRVLVYGKAGAGMVATNGFTITDVSTGRSVSSGSRLDAGWLVGGGVEWAFSSFINGWSMKLEYSYLGLNNRSFTVPASATFLPGDVITAGNRNVQMVKLGFNFLFNNPVASRYY